MMDSNDNKLQRLPAVPASAGATAAAPAAIPGVRPVDAAEAAPPRNRRRPFILVFSVIGLLLASIGGYLLVTAGEQDTDDAQVMADLVPVGTRVAGQLIKVAVKENQLVKKGQLIAEIDP